MKDRAALEYEAGQQKARQRDLVRQENSSVNTLLRSSLVRGDAPVWRPRCVKSVYIYRHKKIYIYCVYEICIYMYIHIHATQWDLVRLEKRPTSTREERGCGG